MNEILNAGLLLAVICAPGQEIDAQLSEPEWVILYRARARIETAEGGVFFVGGVVNSPPLLPEQVGAASAVLGEPVPDGQIPSIRVSVEVYGIATAEAASRFFDERMVTDGWTLESYRLGDRATLATFRGSMRYEIQFQTGRFLVFVGGASREEVERVAGHVLAAAMDG